MNFREALSNPRSLSGPTTDAIGAWGGVGLSAVGVAVPLFGNFKSAIDLAIDYTSAVAKTAHARDYGSRDIKAADDRLVGASVREDMDGLEPSERRPYVEALVRFADGDRTISAMPGEGEAAAIRLDYDLGARLETHQPYIETARDQSRAYLYPSAHTTPEPQAEVADPAAVADVTPEPGAEVADVTPEPGAEVADVTPEPGAEVADVTPEPGAEVADVTPEPGAEVADVTPEPGAEVADVTPEPGAEVADVTPEPGAEVADVTPEPGAEVADVTPEPGAEVADVTPEPGAEVADVTPEPGAEVADVTPEPGAELADVTPEPGAELADVTPEPGAELADVTPEPEAEVAVPPAATDVTPEGPEPTEAGSSVPEPETQEPEAGI